ncbi:uncharacterized protein [Montipora foliosa]|uniref:uncharacterized protein n=1 Tax=Montipora foliosa TaxID=591990 RepID=UPI0035F216FE
MDDLLASKPNSDEAIALARQLIEILAAGEFRLTKRMSNSRDVLAEIPTSEIACDTVNLDRNELTQERALGIKWHAEQDLLSLKPARSEFPNTKRGELSATSSVFDPRGLAALYVLKAKLIVQELWKRHVEWDEVLPDDMLQQWQVWNGGL